MQHMATVQNIPAEYFLEYKKQLMRIDGLRYSQIFFVRSSKLPALVCFLDKKLRFHKFAYIAHSCLPGVSPYITKASIL